LRLSSCSASTASTIFFVCTSKRAPEIAIVEKHVVHGVEDTGGSGRFSYGLRDLWLAFPGLEQLSANCRFVFDAADLITGVCFGFERDVFGDCAWATLPQFERRVPRRYLTAEISPVTVARSSPVGLRVRRARRFAER
jgi:hypothetical protein